ncbi:MAG TPA: DUF4062 domain-containing protein [Puia sp.]|uniref:DUF4062 domain-containing protein n=1 Tax=Puia sp. TaxID=2045100 RepID=UPI002CD9BF73|nr:DUF4062 domain-containing protein [Puia sp.]HVU95661.1 DUF4062 domain-containing protein [Puia sp.]
MEKKYQIFVSSTYEDLKEERDLVIKAILEMGHIPVGMEMFSAGDEEQWKLIQKQIIDSDYYVVIVAFRYGSMDGDIGYTEKEYDYASSNGIPTIGFLINDGVQWSSSKIDKEQDKVLKLNDFKNKIKKKLISFWDSKSDLYGKVSIALMKQFNTNPRTGWVRSNEFAGPEILNEIARLSKENAELRKSLEAINKKSKSEEIEEIRGVLKTLRNNKRPISLYYKNGTGWEVGPEATLLGLFKLLAPELMVEKSVKDASSYIGLNINPSPDKTLRSDWPIPSNSVNEIFADLALLDLVEPSKRRHKIDDKNHYWHLTEWGSQVFKTFRKEHL